MTTCDAGLKNLPNLICSTTSPTHCYNSLCLQEANGDAQETAAMAQAVASPIVAIATAMRMPTPASSRCTPGLLRPRPRRRAHHLGWRP